MFDLVQLDFKKTMAHFIQFPWKKVHALHHVNHMCHYDLRILTLDLISMELYDLRILTLSHDLIHVAAPCHFVL